MSDSRLHKDEQVIVERARRTLTKQFRIDEKIWKQLVQRHPPRYPQRWIVGLVIALAVVMIRRRRARHGETGLTDRDLAGLVGGALGIAGRSNKRSFQDYIADH